MSVWSYFGCPTVAGVLGVVIFYSLLFSEIMLSDMKIPFSRLAMCMMGGLTVLMVIMMVVMRLTGGN